MIMNTTPVAIRDRPAPLIFMLLPLLSLFRTFD